MRKAPAHVTAASSIDQRWRTSSGAARIVPSSALCRSLLVHNRFRALPNVTIAFEHTIAFESNQPHNRFAESDARRPKSAYTRSLTVGLATRSLSDSRIALLDKVAFRRRPCGNRAPLHEARHWSGDDPTALQGAAESLGESALGAPTARYFWPHGCVSSREWSRGLWRLTVLPPSSDWRSLPREIFPVHPSGF
jgi:hypothetical protein